MPGIDDLDPEDFTDERARRLFEAGRKMEDAGRKVSDAGDSMARTGDSMTIGCVVAVVVLVIAGIALFMLF